MEIMNANLTTRQLHLAKLTSIEDLGYLKHLELVITETLAEKVTINEIKEAFSQIYAYTGFPCSLNVLGVLNKVIESHNAKGMKDEEWKAWECPAFAKDQTSIDLDDCYASILEDIIAS